MYEASSTSVTSRILEDNHISHMAPERIVLTVRENLPEGRSPSRPHKRWREQGGELAVKNKNLWCTRY
jgi:hypothetical protein